MIDLRNTVAMFVGDKPVKAVYLGNTLIKSFSSTPQPEEPPIEPEEPEEPTATIYVQVVSSTVIEEDVLLNCTGTLEVRGERRKRPYVFNFYSDEARTIPVSVTNLTLNIKVGQKSTYGGPFTYTSNQITVNGTSHTYSSSFLIYEAYTTCAGINTYFEGIVQVDTGAYVVNQAAYVQPPPPVYIEPPVEEPPVVYNSIKSTGFPLALMTKNTITSANKTLILNESIGFTPENILKPGNTVKSIDANGNITFDYALAETQAIWAKANGLTIHGHCSWWLGKLPTAIKNYIKLSTTTVAKAEYVMQQLVQEPIEYLTTKYPGVLVSWDLINEPFLDSGQIGTSVKYKADDVLTKCGEQIFTKCFNWAYAVAPNLKYFINDYDWQYGWRKLNEWIALYNRIKSTGAPIHGFGLQMHTDIRTTDAAARTYLRQIGATGALVHMSEIGIMANVKSDPRPDFVMTTAIETEAVRAHRGLVHAYLTELTLAQQFRYTYWGTNHPSYWKIATSGQNNTPKIVDFPMLFNYDYSRSAMYNGVLATIKQVKGLA